MASRTIARCSGLSKTGPPPSLCDCALAVPIERARAVAVTETSIDVFICRPPSHKMGPAKLGFASYSLLQASSAGRPSSLACKGSEHGRITIVQSGISRKWLMGNHRQGCAPTDDQSRGVIVAGDAGR